VVVITELLVIICESTDWVALNPRQFSLLIGLKIFSLIGMCLVARQCYSLVTDRQNAVRGSRFAVWTVCVERMVGSRNQVCPGC